MNQDIQTPVKGYKIFNPDFTCKGYQFAENSEFKMDLPIKICNTGFHFCLKASHLFSYYNFNPHNIVCEVEALGEIQYHDEDSKGCTNHIKIGRRLSWEEVLFVANEGKHNTGHSNTGDSNTGYSNTGNLNTGYSNTGNLNTGDWNTGYSNTGDRNTGDRNTGDSNTGYRNTGDRNTGDSNTGDRNTGDRNTGDSNTGDRNTGDRNTGDWNTGDWNTGYSNTGDRNTGVFCTGNATIKLFNKPSTWTMEDFTKSKAYQLMREYVDTKLWVYSSNMTDEEKEKYPSHKTTCGYLKDIPFKEAFQNAWHNWNAGNKKAFTSLPNFDKDIFFEITGVEVK